MVTAKGERYRWAALGAFSLVAGLSQFLWLNYAPLISLVEKQYGVSESQASLLLLAFPLIYVLLSIPAGIWIDRKGYRFSSGFGAVLMAIFACLRIDDHHFWVILLAQAGIAIAQPFVINALPKLVLDWFRPEQGALANGLGTMGMFVGMAAGMALTPPLVEAAGLRHGMGILALASIAIAVAFLGIVRENPARLSVTETTLPGATLAFKHLLQQREQVLLYILSFLGLGFFNGFTTWIEPILAPNGINSAQAGVVGGALILGGIVGAAVIPAGSDYFRRRKPFLIGSIGVALVTLYPLCFLREYGKVLAFGAAQGFCFLPAFSLLLEMCADHAGESLAGSATSLLMLSGNAGGVATIVAMEWVKGPTSDFTPAVYLLFALLGTALVGSFLIHEPIRAIPGSDRR